MGRMPLCRHLLLRIYMVHRDIFIRRRISVGYSLARQSLSPSVGHSSFFHVLPPPSPNPFFRFCLLFFLGRLGKLIAGGVATFSHHPILNIIFGIVFGTAMYCFAQAVVSDPGYLPRPAGISEQKKIVEELVVRGEFDARHFCTSCFVRKSLRSKHCRVCERCVARHDQYIPALHFAH